MTTFIEELMDTFDYDSETGNLIRKKSGYGWLKGQVAGYKASDGYIRVGFKRKRYSAHRLIWAISNGSMPPNHLDIDHINHIRDDNRIENLRLCSRSENLHNNTKLKSNTSGYTGVHSHQGKWRATIWLKDKKYHLGMFHDAKTASLIYNKAKNYLHPSTKYLEVPLGR